MLNQHNELKGNCFDQHRPRKQMLKLSTESHCLVIFTEKQINKVNYKGVEIKVRLRELFEYPGKENSTEKTASGIVW